MTRKTLIYTLFAAGMVLLPSTPLMVLAETLGDPEAVEGINSTSKEMKAKTAQKFKQEAKEQSQLPEAENKLSNDEGVKADALMSLNHQEGTNQPQCPVESLKTSSTMDILFRFCTFLFLLAILGIVIAILRSISSLQKRGEESFSGKDTQEKRKTHTNEPCQPPYGPGKGHSSVPLGAVNTMPKDRDNTVPHPPSANSNKEVNNIVDPAVHRIEKTLGEIKEDITNVVSQPKTLAFDSHQEFLQKCVTELQNINESFIQTQKTIDVNVNGMVKALVVADQKAEKDMESVNRLETILSLAERIKEKNDKINEKDDKISGMEQQINELSSQHDADLGIKDNEINALRQELRQKNEIIATLQTEVSQQDDPYYRLIPPEVLALFGMSKRDLKTDSFVPLFPAIHAVCAFMEWAGACDGSRFAVEIAKMDKILTACVTDGGALQRIRDNLEVFVASEVSSALQGKYVVKWNFIGENYNQTLHYSKGEGLRITRVLSPLVEVNGKIITRAEVECQ